jgi:hypothetical protein
MDLVFVNTENKKLGVALVMAVIYVSTARKKISADNVWRQGNEWRVFVITVYQNTHAEYMVANIIVHMIF